MSAPELRRDPLSGRLVVIAPGRARRPGAAASLIPAATAEELETCPFCEGREDQTPPETLAVGRREGEPNTPGWSARVVPNLYPAVERQEVVVHSPRHARSFAELTNEEIAFVARAWADRAAAAQAEGFGYVHALLNEGRDAGASLAHSHSQLVWLREPPPSVAAERRDGGCGVCELLDREGADDALGIGEASGVRILVAYAGRLPYELLIAGEHGRSSPFEANELLAAALGLLADGLRALRALEGPVPVNAWLHDGEHWHIEVVPRLSVLAGLELGAGIYVNTLAPEEAARRLREARA